MDEITVYCDRGHDETSGVVVWFNDDGIGSRWVEYRDRASGMEIRRQFITGDGQFINDRKMDTVAEFSKSPSGEVERPSDEVRARFTLTCATCGYRVERVAATIELKLTQARDAGVGRVSLRLLG